MFTILDRQMIYSYFKAYLFCLVSLMGLFIIVDLFMHLDEFMTQHKDLESVLRFVSVYYGYKSFMIFDRLCEAIILLAGMFTVAWMQRNNELLPLLSAGVSTRRVVQPVLLCAFAMMGLVALNQEFALPQIDSFMLDNRLNPDGAKESDVKATYDMNNILIWGRTAIKKEGIIKEVYVNIPKTIGGTFTVLIAKEAQYVPEEEGNPCSGGWMLRETAPADLPEWPKDQEDILKPLGDGRYFLHTKEVDPETMTRVKNWYLYMPTWRLLRELERPTDTQHSIIAVEFHTRLTRPLVGMILILMGLSVILRDQNRNVFISAGMCLIMCGIYFGTLFMCKHLGKGDTLTPALAAWLPVFLFGPISALMYAEVHT
jgi:lipopolysaccharide export system permease protein